MLTVFQNLSNFYCGDDVMELIRQRFSQNHIIMDVYTHSFLQLLHWLFCITKNIERKKKLQSSH